MKGKLNNIDTEQVLLYQAKGLNANQFDVMDTLSIDADSTFSSSYSLEPHYYRLSIHDSLHVPFIADSGQQITMNIPAEGEYEVSGSPDTELFEEYEKFRMEVLRETVYPVRGQLDDLREENNPEDAERIEKLGERVLKAEESYRDTLIHAVKKMGTSIAIYPTMVRWKGDKHIDYYEGLAADFSEQHKGLEVAELVSEKIRTLKQVSIGDKVSEIVAPDTSGVERSLYNNLGKYTLIDFFGSWCGPCRSESDHLGKMYDQYNSSGFEIFGFGIEYEKDRWIRAINKDNRTWINVSTVDGYSNDIAEAYSITAIPKNFLVDENGIIIAKDIHGQELKEKLEELFSEQSQ
ncbi:TlpA family protein disulfide reductase [Aliifodinibius salipaludis]|uniref:TlpA family protein disulfide reductase n=1 Tax=Fodinibius salipaludis TaxID=2032627 RepID=UPI001140AFDF|nr:TlpA disulfide reductase family protein [Aliifodinibius salipaludis]